jgi:hypothetical protein
MQREKPLKLLFARARKVDNRLSDWMRRHHDDLLLELGSGRVAAWAPVMRIVDELGLRDDRGNTPTRDTVARTWQRVKKDVAQRRRKAPALAPGEIAPGVRALQSGDDREGPQPPKQEEPRRPLAIRPARMKGTSQPGGASKPQDTAMAPRPNTARDGAADEIKRVLDRMGSRRTPLPKTVR